MPPPSRSELTPAQSEARARIRAAMVEEGLLFPRIYRAYVAYARRPPSRGALFSLQRRRLGRVLRHALADVPAFREYGADLGDVAPKDPFLALSWLPLTDKDAIVERYADHCSDTLDPRSCRKKRTSGTTGVPLDVIYDLATLAHDHALTWIRARRVGDPFHRRILEAGRGTGAWFESVSPAKAYAIVGRYDDSLVEQSNFQPVAEQITAFAPTVVAATPSRLLRLADLYQATAGAGGPPQVGLVYSHSEQLTPGARDRLSSCFSAPVCDLYGMSEVITIAAQCEANSYHLNSERIWVDVIDGVGRPVADGEAGELVVTDLLNTAMPFLRYRTGDRGALELAACPCGRPQKTLRLLEGRGSEVLRFPGGLEVDAVILKRIVMGEGVRRFQLVFHPGRQLEVLLEPSSAWSEAWSDTLRSSLLTQLPPMAQLVVRVVHPGHFREGPSGKFVDFVSLPPGDQL